MNIENRVLVGALLFVGVAQFILVIAITEAQYPGYSVSTNVLNDLGVGQTALLFNASVAVLGVCVVAGALIGQPILGTDLTFTLALTGACAVGVGLLAETTGMPHAIFAIATFVFGAVSAIISFRLLRPPLSYVSVGLGIIALAVLVLTLTRHELGLGPGGIERLIAYPIFLWALGFGASLIGAK
jgi:hypothetical membrane protein